MNLLIARHGNTFDKGQVVRRVGARTDLPLSNSGKVQAQALGDYLQTLEQNIQMVYTSNLKRTQQTAQIALAQLDDTPNVKSDACFDEIDYGVDEGQAESAVIERVGPEALARWEQANIPVPGWQVCVATLQAQWYDFAQQLLQNHLGQTVLVVTSNGVARFASCLLPQAVREEQQAQQGFKLSTGALAYMFYEGNAWHLRFWNKRP